MQATHMLIPSALIEGGELIHVDDWVLIKIKVQRGALTEEWKLEYPFPVQVKSYLPSAVQDALYVKNSVLDTRLELSMYGQAVRRLVKFNQDVPDYLIKIESLSDRFLIKYRSEDTREVYLNNESGPLVGYLIKKGSKLNKTCFGVVIAKEGTTQENRLNKKYLINLQAERNWLGFYKTHESAISALAIALVRQDKIRF